MVRQQSEMKHELAELKREKIKYYRHEGQTIKQVKENTASHIKNR